MPMGPLALVTGSSSRLGRAFAASLARHGYAVFLHYHQAESSVQKVADELRDLGVGTFLFRADLTQPDDISAMFREVDRTARPLKVLVNSAAVMRRADPRTASLAEWQATLDLNLRAPWLCSQEAARRMGDGGLIVNVTDVGARKAWSGYPIYTISKAGLEAATRIMARAFAPKIRVNAIAPGLVFQSTALSDQEWAKLVRRVPMQGPAVVKDVVAALDFLLASEYVTGETITVDGGYSLLG